jgi:hypothetical protein
MPAKPPGYWKEFATLERELLAFIDEHGVPGAMPTHQTMRSAGRLDLVRGIRSHGGMVAVGERLGLAHRGQRKTHNYWKDPANIERELLAFIAEHGEPGVMPKKREMEQAGRLDLSLAITRSGGQRAVAQRLGLRPADSRRAPNQWADFANLERELRAFIAEPGRPLRMPTLHELVAAGRFDLHYAIQRHGGVGKIGKRLGLATASNTRPPKREQDSGARNTGTR